MTEDASPTLADVGEKRLIEELIRPLFNPSRAPEGVGDDCAIVYEPPHGALIASTDRVPSDFTLYRQGVLDLKTLASHLARLNISDIAACGGSPLMLLLNLGLPAALPVAALESICHGFLEAATAENCSVAGGDLSSAAELNLVATAIGVVGTGDVLMRHGARSGDLIFTSRPLGLTPAALAYFGQESEFSLNKAETRELRRQVSRLRPMVSLGRLLSNSRRCTSCMDNTDGVAQTLRELAAASGKRFVIDRLAVEIPDLVIKVAALSGIDPFTFAMSAGADFSLIGTLRPNIWASSLGEELRQLVHVIGRVADGDGLFQERDGRVTEVVSSGWSYFAASN